MSVACYFVTDPFYRQKYKLLKAKIQQLHQHTNDAFAFPLVSMAFLPADGFERARAMM
jgi:hypothetical protein